MRKKIVVLSSLVLACVMAAPGLVSAGAMTTVAYDSQGDVGFGVDPRTGWVMHTWGENTPVAKAGYFDMVSTWFSQKGRMYTFGMEMAAALPKAGSPLPTGIHLAEWAVWIDPSPFNTHTNPVAPLFLISLRYDGTSYSAFVMDYATMTSTPAQYSIDGASLQLQFSTASVNYQNLPWWSPLVKVWWGPLGSAGSWFVDGVDPGAVPGQDGIDLPWPPV